MRGLRNFVMGALVGGYVIGAAIAIAGAENSPARDAVLLRASIWLVGSLIGLAIMLRR